MAWWQVFLLGTLGGAFLELVNANKYRYTEWKKWPQYAKEPHYWFFGLAWGLTGGALAWLYQASGAPLSPFLCANIGASAPLILQTLLRNAPAGPPGPVDPEDPTGGA